MPELFDMRLIQRGARLRRSPFFDATHRYGCKAYTVYNHTFLPSYYDDPEKEYWHLLEHVTLWDVSVERNVEIAGKDGAKLMDMITPRDMTKVAVGQGKYVVITAPDGGIVNDPVLLRLEKNKFWLALADSDVLLYTLGVAANAGLDVDVSEPEAYPLQIQGPKSKQVVKALFGPKVLDLDYYWFLDTKVDGIPVIVTRTGWTGEVGYEVYLRDASRGDDLWEKIMAAGKAYNIRPTGPSDIRRVEAGILNWGADIGLDTNPYEVGLGWLVDEDKKADYLGKKALRRIKKEGVKRKLVGIEIDGAPIEFNMTKWSVQTDGKAVGKVTSAIYSPRLKKNIGYANVPVKHAKLGTTLTVQHPSGPRRATVVKKPFVDPKKDIPKS